MKIKIRFTGRKSGAIGVFHPIGTFEGEGATEQEAIDSARLAAYAAGFEHVQCADWRTTKTAETFNGLRVEQVPGYEVLS